MTDVYQQAIILCLQSKAVTCAKIEVVVIAHQFYRVLHGWQQLL